MLDAGCGIPSSGDLRIWLPAGADFVGQAAGSLGEKAGTSKGVVVSQLWQRLSLTLWRANARAILHRAPVGEMGVWGVAGAA